MLNANDANIVMFSAKEYGIHTILHAMNRPRICAPIDAILLQLLRERSISVWGDINGH